MKLLVNLVIGSVLVLLIGCKASPANVSEFTGKFEYMKEDKQYPFHKVWRDKSVALDDYKKVYVAPVFIWCLEEQGFREKVNDVMAFSSQTDYVAELADKLRDEIKKELKEKKSDNRFILAEKPGPDTLKIETALIQAVPTNVIVNSIKILTLPVFLIFPVAIPIKLAINIPLNLFFPSGKVAFETRVSDSVTGQVLLCVADREKTPLKLLHLSDYTTLGHQKKIIEDWAKQIVRSLNKEKGESIEDTPAYTFWPW